MSDVRVNYDQCTWTSRPFNVFAPSFISVLQVYLLNLQKLLQSLKTVENIKEL